MNILPKNTGRGSDRAPPDGIPCPFCTRSKTKFRYFNNRKVEQPRYQCEGCHKFWTQGGRIRRKYVKRNGKMTVRVKQPSIMPGTPDTESQPRAAETSTTMPERNGLVDGSEGAVGLHALADASLKM